MALSLSIDYNASAFSGGRTNLYQGTVAIAAWLSGLAANQAANAGVLATASPTPQVAPSFGSNSYSQFRSQVGAAATAQSDAAQPANGNAADYQQAVAAYGDN